MRVERVDHVGVYVKDIDRAIGFFTKVFGLKFSKPFAPPGEDVTQVLEPLGINLMAGKTPDSPLSRLIERKGEGLAALTLKVEDIETAISELKGYGVRPVKRGNYGENARWATFHPKDTFGVFINLVQYDPPHPYLACFEEKA